MCVCGGGGGTDEGTDGGVQRWSRCAILTSLHLVFGCRHTAAQCPFCVLCCWPQVICELKGAAACAADAGECSLCTRVDGKQLCFNPAVAARLSPCECDRRVGSRQAQGQGPVPACQPACLPAALALPPLPLPVPSGTSPIRSPRPEHHRGHPPPFLPTRRRGFQVQRRPAQAHPHGGVPPRRPLRRRARRCLRCPGPGQVRCAGEGHFFGRVAYRNGSCDPQFTATRARQPSVAGCGAALPELTPERCPSAGQAQRAPCLRLCIAASRASLVWYQSDRPGGVHPTPYPLPHLPTHPSTHPPTRPPIRPMNPGRLR